jgi:hypothetical protein
MVESVTQRNGKLPAKVLLYVIPNITVEDVIGFIQSFQKHLNGVKQSNKKPETPFCSGAYFIPTTLRLNLIYLYMNMI